MKHIFILGLLLIFISTVPVHAQSEPSYLSSSNAIKYMKQSRGNRNFKISNYRLLGYYLLKEGRTDHANTYFDKAKKKAFSMLKTYEYNPESIAKEIERLKTEALKRYSVDAVFDTNPIFQEEEGLYRSVKKKSYEIYYNLLNRSQTIRGDLTQHIKYGIEKEKILKKVIENHRDLLKPKSEFETKEQYTLRKNKYATLELNAIKEIEENIKNLFMPYGQAETKCIQNKNAIDRRKKSNDFVDKYQPELKSYIDSRIREMTYDAEKQVFKMVVEFSGKKYIKKKYTIKVPQSEAKRFKEEKSTNKYFFFLQDLRAVIVGDKVYRINPVKRWYNRLICNSPDIKKGLINGKKNGSAILKKIIETDSEIQKNVTAYLKEESAINRINAKLEISFFPEGENRIGIHISKIYPDYLPNGNIDDLYQKIRVRTHKLIRDYEITYQSKSCEPRETKFRLEIHISQ